MSDADYRVRLLAQCQINQSRGEPERLIAALIALTGATFTKVLEYQPASVVQEFSGGTIPSQLGNQMRRVKAAGVAYNLIQTDDANAFLLGISSNHITNDTVHGTCVSSDQTFGGKLGQSL